MALVTFALKSQTHKAFHQFGKAKACSLPQIERKRTGDSINLIYIYIAVAPVHNHIDTADAMAGQHPECFTGKETYALGSVRRPNDVPVVPYVWFTDRQWDARRDEMISAVESRLGYPVIVKPANLGSSVGIGRAKDREQLLERVADAQRYSSRIVVEHMVDDLQEINCSRASH